MLIWLLKIYVNWIIQMLKTHFGILIKSVSFEQESDTIDEISL